MTNVETICATILGVAGIVSMVAIGYISIRAIYKLGLLVLLPPKNKQKEIFMRSEVEIIDMLIEVNRGINDLEEEYGKEDSNVDVISYVKRRDRLEAIWDTLNWVRGNYKNLELNSELPQIRE